MFSRYPAARAAGVAVGLGTDGAGSNDSLDLLADLKTFALVQKHAAADPTAIDAAEAWAVATGANAPRLGATKLEPGAPPTSSSSAPTRRSWASASSPPTSSTPPPAPPSTPPSSPAGC